MPAVALLCQLMGVEPHKLSIAEILIIEIELFCRICEELKIHFRSQYKEYFQLLRVNAEMENNMLDINSLRYMINDIILTEEYSLTGIACYTHMPEEIICDIATGKNKEPSLLLSRKIMDIHRSVRPNLYYGIMKKIIHEYLSEQNSQQLTKHQQGKTHSTI